jgi:hypothetical protein
MLQRTFRLVTSGRREREERVRVFGSKNVAAAASSGDRRSRLDRWPSRDKTFAIYTGLAGGAQRGNVSIYEGQREVYVAKLLYRPETRSVVHF